MIRIAILLEKYLPASETFIPTQLYELNTQCDLHLFYLDDLNFVEKEHTIPKTKVGKVKKGISMSVSNFLSSRNIFFPYINTIDDTILTKELDAFNPDLFLIHFGKTALTYSSILNKYSQPKFIYFHGYDASQLIQLSKSYSYFLSKLLHKNYYPIFVSEALKINFEKSISIKNGKVIHLGIDTGIFVRSDLIKPIKNIFIQVGRFVEKKGHALLLNAYIYYLEKYNDIESELWLVGDGPLKDKIELVIIEKQLLNNIKVLGFKNSNEIKILFENATVYLQHSITSSTGDMEGLPISMMEAMSMELPIISTIHSGIPELVEDKVNGFLSNEKDIKTFADNMYKATKLGLLKNNGEKINADFNTKSQTKKLLDYIKSVIL